MYKGKILSKLVRPLSKGQITLPIEFRRRLNIDTNTVLNVSLKGERIEIVPLRTVPRSSSLREYTQDQIQRFVKEDQLDVATATKIQRLLGRRKQA